MSAAEKLRALLTEMTQPWPEGHAESECIDCYTPAPEIAKRVMPALPQIVAVVEAAETLVGNQRHPRVSISDVSPGSSERARAALAALDEALS